MKKNVFLFILFFFLSSCLNNAVRDSHTEFSPYNDIAVENPAVWNLAFRLMRSQLMESVTNSLPDYPNQIGLIAELNGPDKRRRLIRIFNYPVIRAWSIFEKDIFSLPPSDLELLNEGGSQSPYQDVPKIKFFVRSKGNRYEILARLWLKNFASYNWIYDIRKGPRGWYLHSRTSLNP